MPRQISAVVVKRDLKNFIYKFFFDHDLAMEVAQKTFISNAKEYCGLAEV